jgi:hypothetical protein
MPAGIPGFYYDSDKKKYFKIQPNHQAPSGSNYSQQAVKAEGAVKQEQVRQHAQQHFKVASTVKRSKLLIHPLTSFNRRIDDRPKKSARKCVAEYFAASLEGRNAVTESLVFLPSDLSLPPPRFTDKPVSGQFAIDPISGIMCADVARTIVGPHGRSRPGDVDMMAYYRSTAFLSDSATLELSDTECPRTLYVTNQQLSTSMSRCNRVELIRSWLPGKVAWTETFQPTYGPQASNLQFGSCPDEPDGHRLDWVHQKRISNRVIDIAVRESDGLLVYATRHSIGLLHTSVMTGSSSQYNFNVDSVPNMTHVAFKDHNTVMCGTRSGKVLLFDVRTLPAEQIAASVRIQHGAAITSLFALGRDDNVVLVTGIPHSSVYDLRYTPSPRLKSHMPQCKTHHLTTPTLALNIPKSREQTRFGLGISYDAELNILLSASTDHHRNHRVGLWDVSTGKMLDSPICETRFRDPVICAQIVSFPDCLKSVVLSDGGTFWEYNATGVHGGRDYSEEDIW